MALNSIVDIVNSVMKQTFIESLPYAESMLAIFEYVYFSFDFYEILKRYRDEGLVS